jgi:hypothetical protein
MFEEWIKKRRDEFMENVGPDVQLLLDLGQPITWEEYVGFTMNSYERVLLYPLLTDDAILKLTEYCYDQSNYRKLHQYRLPQSYNDAVTDLLIPMIMERFKSIIDKDISITQRVPSVLHDYR